MRAAGGRLKKSDNPLPGSIPLDANGLEKQRLISNEYNERKRKRV